MKTELESRNIPVVILATESLPFPADLNRMDLVVGDFNWTKTSLKQLGVAMPSPPDYPKCLEHLLYRNMWSSTLGEVRNTLANDPTAKFFVKPSQETKAFSGGVYQLDDIEGFMNGIEGVPEYPAWGE